jgi:hypothetical protein
LKGDLKPPKVADGSKLEVTTDFRHVRFPLKKADMDRKGRAPKISLIVNPFSLFRPYKFPVWNPLEFGRIAGE